MPLLILVSIRNDHPCALLGDLGNKVSAEKAGAAEDGDGMARDRGSATGRGTDSDDRLRDLPARGLDDNVMGELQVRKVLHVAHPL
jgi:hypothetical protein